MYKSWKHVVASGGLTLVFRPYDADEEEIAYVHKDECGGGDWIISSGLLGKYRENLECEGATEAEVKAVVEEMVKEHYQGEINYYSDLLRMFAEE